VEGASGPGENWGSQKQHPLELSLRNEALGVEYKERIFFGAAESKVQTYGLKSLGSYPGQKQIFTIGLGAFPAKELQEMALTLKIQDAEGNVVADRQTAVRPAAEPLLHQADVTPAVAGAVGPFNLDAGVENDVHGISFSTSQRFAHANALVPLSSMEQRTRRCGSPPRTGIPTTLPTRTITTRPTSTV
jgi:hypothetical protein